MLLNRRRGRDSHLGENLTAFVGPAKKEAIFESVLQNGLKRLGLVFTAVMQQDKFVDAPDAIQLSRREGLGAQLLELENAFTDTPTPSTQSKCDDTPCAV